ncbi:uncharacterized protein EI90DRAFT_2315646 [Cantharellus anzutake]|uniref:uncharacterized protein n=1 Tax=Cantharellus anzutake TaxID=1750568 RepID=UPI001903F880|nr:uncharacterized protein EI90DRAFT_2315646 [Cantharellus anzutake]KAF8339991.1 hypothetical protein EI90DRAFT_2315646 [Cantharellus anzutake]
MATDPNRPPSSVGAQQQAAQPPHFLAATPHFDHSSIYATAVSAPGGPPHPSQQPMSSQQQPTQPTIWNQLQLQRTHQASHPNSAPQTGQPPQQSAQNGPSPTPFIPTSQVRNHNSRPNTWHGFNNNVSSSNSSSSSIINNNNKLHSLPLGNNNSHLNHSRDKYRPLNSHKLSSPSRPPDLCLPFEPRSIFSRYKIS